MSDPLASPPPLMPPMLTTYITLPTEKRLPSPQSEQRYKHIKNLPIPATIARPWQDGKILNQTYTIIPKGDPRSITNGGCRFLHQARYAFLGQCKLLRKVPGWTENIMPYEVTDEMREFATYTMPSLEGVDFSEPVAEVGVRRIYRLTLHPALASHVIDGTEEASRFTSRQLLRHCKAEARIAREVFYEWFRLRLSAGLDLDEDVFALIRNDCHYWAYLRTYYNELRRIYLHTTGIMPPRDEVCDQKNAATAQSALDREAEHVRQLKALVKQCCNRMAFYANVLADDDSAVSSPPGGCRSQHLQQGRR